MKYTQRDYWGGSWYPYWTLMIITVLGGFFGLDHFWLRSPVTGITKLVVNMFTLGLWYIYDIIQVYKDKDLVMKHGLSVPIKGPLGIGAGVFRDSNPGGPTGKSPFRWLFYILLTLLPFGFDFFIAGDSNGAFARFLTSFIIFLWPIGFIWGLLNTGRAIFKPEELWEKGTYRMFPFNFFMSSYGPSTLGPKDVDNSAECSSGWKGMFLALPTIVQSAISVFFPQVAVAVNGVASATTAVAGTAEAVADSATQLIKATTGTVVPVVGAVSSVAREIPGALDTLQSAPSIAGKALQGFTDPAVLQKMVGGGSKDNMDDMLVTALLTALIGGGAVLGYLRYIQKKEATRNDRKDNDTPPKPTGA